MADHDVIADPLPQIANNPNYGRKTITELKAALTAQNASYYTAARLHQMTYNDMVYAVRNP